MKISELECAKEARIENLKRYGNYGFNFENYPAGLRTDMEEFVKFRGSNVKLTSIKSEIHPFNSLGSFFSEEYPAIKGFLSEDRTEVEKRLKKWLIKKGKPLYYETKKLDRVRTEHDSATEIVYLRKIYKFLQRDIQDEDILNLDELVISPVKNLTHMQKTMSFKNIPQTVIRNQAKEIISYRLLSVSVGTAYTELTAINHFSKFIFEYHPNIKSLCDVTWDVMKDYRKFLEIDEIYRKDKRKLYQGMERLLQVAEKLYGKPEYDKISSIVKQDWRKSEKVFQYYTKTELDRIMAALPTVSDCQVRRFFYLIKQTGTRMDNLLLLRQDCLREKKGVQLIRIPGGKTRNPYEIPISEETRLVINRCIEYTREMFPESEFVFANKKDPRYPMTTATIKYHFKKLIIENDLRDDNGEPLLAKTHNFRRSLGKALADAGRDDLTIARSLGHKGQRAVDRYREISPEHIYDSTKSTVDKLERMVDEIYGKSLHDIE